MAQEEHGAHAGVPLYAVFAVILSVITASEWAIFRFREPWGVSTPMLVGSLAVMSLVKFFMVVGWYMHLRYDPKMLKFVFLFSFLMISGTAAGLLMLMMHV